MFDPWWAVAAALAIICVWIVWKRRREGTWLRRARREFHLRREWLEVDFMTMGAAGGAPAGLLWENCQFQDDAAFAIDRISGQLRAFVAVTIPVDAGVKPPRTSAEQRPATAVFLYDGRRWIPEGPALLNLNPQQAIEHFHHELELVD